MDKPIAIQVRGVSKTFEQGGVITKALDRCDFSARAGELSMIVGPSGSGKTTLLSVIAGTLSYDEGSVQIFDMCLDGKRPEDITQFRQNHIGFIFQQYHLIKTLSCMENVSIPLLLQGKSRMVAEKKARELLEQVGLKEKIGLKPKFLSGGQQQRVAIARALVHDPPVIVCDEPTAALDADTGQKTMELIQQHAIEKDRCVLVVTHDARIFSFADQIVKMDDGQIRSTENFDKEHRG